MTVGKRERERTGGRVTVLSRGLVVWSAQIVCASHNVQAN